MINISELLRTRLRAKTPTVAAVNVTHWISAHSLPRTPRTYKHLGKKESREKVAVTVKFLQHDPHWSQFALQWSLKGVKKWGCVLLQQTCYNLPSQRKYTNPNARNLDLAHKVIKAVLGKGCMEESANTNKSLHVWIISNVTKCVFPDIGQNKLDKDDWQSKLVWG